MSNGKPGKELAMSSTEIAFLTPMAQYLIRAMEGRGKMSNKAIYREVKRVCEEARRELPSEWKAEIRQTLQSCCPGRPQHNGRDDFFIWHGWGYWSCKAKSPSLDDFDDLLD